MVNYKTVISFKTQVGTTSQTKKLDKYRLSDIYRGDIRCFGGASIPCPDIKIT
jgi:hypothetical protein